MPLGLSALQQALGASPRAAEASALVARELALALLELCHPHSVQAPGPLVTGSSLRLLQGNISRVTPRCEKHNSCSGKTH